MLCTKSTTHFSCAHHRLLGAMHNFVGLFIYNPKPLTPPFLHPLSRDSGLLTTLLTNKEGYYIDLKLFISFFNRFVLHIKESVYTDRYPCLTLNCYYTFLSVKLSSEYSAIQTRISITIKVFYLLKKSFKIKKNDL